jgi:hypothetical protein
VADKCIAVVPQPPIRQILVPVTSFYSPGSKPLDNIQKSVTDELKGIPALLQAMEKTPPTLVAAQGNYFEGDNPVL